MDSLARLVAGEAHLRHDRATQSRRRLARFPVITTVEPCRWDWPTQMTRLQGQPPCHLACLQAQAHLIFLGGVGLGHTHVATALGSAACLKGYAVLCASAMDGINPLAAAKSAGRLTPARRTYPKPALLLLDELGYLPMDQAGADLLCHVLSLRDEQGAIIMTSHRAFKEWPTPRPSSSKAAVFACKTNANRPSRCPRARRKRPWPLPATPSLAFGPQHFHATDFLAFSRSR